MKYSSVIAGKRLMSINFFFRIPYSLFSSFQNIVYYLLLVEESYLIYKYTYKYQYSKPLTSKLYLMPQRGYCCHNLGTTDEIVFTSIESPSPWIFYIFGVIAWGTLAVSSFVFFVKFLNCYYFDPLKYPCFILFCVFSYKLYKFFLPKVSY